MTTEDKTEVEQEELTPEEAQADFKSGFDRILGDDDATAEEAAAPVQPEEDPESEEAKAKAKIAADREKFLDGLPARIRGLEGQVGGLKGQLNQAIKEVTAKAATSPETPSNRQVQSALNDPAAYADLVEDYPGFKPVLDELRVTRQTIDGLQEQVQTLSASKSEPAAAAAPASQPESREEDKLTQAHPDWQRIAKDPEFNKWALEGGPSAADYKEVVTTLKADPERGQELLKKFQSDHADWWNEKGTRLFGPTAEDSIEIIDKYKARSKPKPAPAPAPDPAKQEQLRRQRRLSAAVTTEGTGSSPVVSVTDQQAFSRGFSKVIKGRK